MAADQWKAAFLAACLRRPISLKWVEYRCSWTWKLVEHILISEPYQRLYWRHFRFSEKIEKWSLQTYKFLSVSFIVHILVRAACWPWHAAFASDFQPLTELLAKDDRCHGSAMGFLFWTWQFFDVFCGKCHDTDWNSCDLSPGALASMKPALTGKEFSSHLCVGHGKLLQALWAT